ncbi:hypothetical protein [Paenibacillus agaridevorans]|nr:hypothetical protein [Paenibacillus agaridevorans]
MDAGTKQYGYFLHCGERLGWPLKLIVAMKEIKEGVIQKAIVNV